MLELVKHTLRQIIFRWFQFNEDPVYLVFEQLYQYNAAPFPWIIKHPKQRGFVLTNFICPEFSCYKGREITFFDSKHVCVYWLPGAKHTAGGYVETGEYSVTIYGFALKQPLELHISKNDQETLIQSVNSTMRQNKKSLKGGFIAFPIIVKELECLILLWLEHLAADIVKNETLKSDVQLKALLQKTALLSSLKIAKMSHAILKTMQ